MLTRCPSPVRQIVRDVEEGVGAPYGAELLLELSRLLPGAVEVRLGVGKPPATPADCRLLRPPSQVSRLRAFSGCPQQLPEPELFMLLLLEVPRWEPGGLHEESGGSSRSLHLPDPPLAATRSAWS